MSQGEKNHTGSFQNQIDYLVASLLDFFRDPKHEQKHLYAAKIASRQISLHVGNISNFDKRFIYFSRTLKNNFNPQSIRRFAEECFLSLASSKFLKDDLTKEDYGEKSLRKKAQQNISISLAAGQTQDAALRRAAHELVREKRKHDQANQLLHIARNHPLKDMLIACRVTEKPLAKEDIKNQFLRLKKKTGNSQSGVLYGLLEKAQAFSAPRLHRLLGDELFFLCRPIGFLDALGTTLMVEVPTNAHLHALSYRKLEIIRALKKDLAFQKIRTIRFKVMNTMI